MTHISSHATHLNSAGFWAQQPVNLPTLASLKRLSDTNQQRLEYILHIIRNGNRRDRQELYIELVDNTALDDLFPLSQANNQVYNFMTNPAYNTGWQARFEHLGYSVSPADNHSAFEHLMGSFLAYHYRLWEMADRSGDPQAVELHQAATSRGIVIDNIPIAEPNERRLNSLS